MRRPMNQTDTIDPLRLDCTHRHEKTRNCRCSTCRRRKWLSVFRCDVHGECTLKKRTDGVAGVCATPCPDYSAPGSLESGVTVE